MPCCFFPICTIFFPSFINVQQRTSNLGINFFQVEDFSLPRLHFESSLALDRSTDWQIFTRRVVSHRKILASPSGMIYDPNETNERILSFFASRFSFRVLLFHFQRVKLWFKIMIAYNEFLKKFLHRSWFIYALIVTSNNYIYKIHTDSSQVGLSGNF